MRDLTVHDVITVLLGFAVLVLAVAVWRLTDSGQAEAPADADDGEVTQEAVDELWLDFYTSRPPRSRWHHWRHLDRQELR
ncbi:hypothetical protein AB0M91_09215 [Micromonospora rifamycinica]|uniref:hypothetical protein n=1 Tax=Micromonospora rifamycinica TaxID=291594 RepID=UPI00343E7BE6